jgi:hypothetical protein
MACFLDWLALVVVRLAPFAPTANSTKLTRMLVRYVNDWQQAYGPGCGWLAVENKVVFIKTN